MLYRLLKLIKPSWTTGNAQWDLSVDLLRLMRASLARSAFPVGLEDPAPEGSQLTY